MIKNNGIESQFALFFCEYMRTVQYSNCNQLCLVTDEE